MNFQLNLLGNEPIYTKQEKVFLQEKGTIYYYFYFLQRYNNYKP